jgi:hypothetical protein
VTFVLVHWLRVCLAGKKMFHCVLERLDASWGPLEIDYVQILLTLPELLTHVLLPYCLEVVGSSDS